MAKNKNKGEEDSWAEYFSSIEKQEKQAKKGPSIGEALKHLLESIGIGKEKKTSLEEVKKQVSISAEEGWKKTAAEDKEKPAVERRFGRWAVREKETASEGEAAKKFPERKELPSSMERYLEKVEEKKRTEEKEREFEALAEKRAAEEKAKQEKPVVPKKVLPQAISQSFFLGKKKVLPEAVSQSFFLGKKKVLLLPKAEKEKAADAKKAEEKKPVQAGKKAAEEKAAKEKRVAEKKPAFESKKGREEKKRVAAGKASKGMAGAPAEKDIAVFFRPASSLAGKSVEEIKKLSPKEIRKELDKEKIEDRARGWYGDSLRHKKAAVSGWRLRKKVKLHQLKKKEKQKSLSEKEKKTMKKLVAEDRALRNRVRQLDQQIKSLQKIASEKKKKNQELEKKIRAIGVALPEKETLPAEGEENQLKKVERVQLVETMKKIADEMAATAARESMASFEAEEAMPIEDAIKVQENMIKNLEMAFYKRKIDFDQFREKMFDYQSKLTEMKIRKKINDEKMKNMPPKMRLVMEKKIAAGEAGKGVGITPKTAEALEKVVKGKAGEKEVGAEAIEAIKRIAEKQAAQAEKETKETRAAEKTTSILGRIAEKLGNMSRGGASQQQGKAGAPGQQPTQPTLPSYQGGTGQQTKAHGKETQIPQAQPVVQKGKAQQQAYAGLQYKGLVYRETQQPPKREAGGMPKPAADFYEDEKPQKPKKEFFGRLGGRVPQKPKKEFFGRLGGRVSEKPVSRQPVGKEIGRAIREKAVHADVSKEQINRVEKKLSELLERYNIPEKAVANHIKSFDEGRLIEDFQKLINLIEDKREKSAIEFIMPAPGFDISSGIISKKKEKIEGTEKEIRRTRIETSFDKVLAIVQAKGIISLNDAAMQLGMSKEEVQQCTEVLERSRLINLSYPPIGSVKLIYPAYLKWKAEEKKKEAEEKKRKKGKK